MKEEIKNYLNQLPYNISFILGENARMKKYLQSITEEEAFNQVMKFSSCLIDDELMNSAIVENQQTKKFLLPCKRFAIMY